MNDPNAFGYQENPASPLGPGRPPPGGLNSMAQYKFTADEMRVLQECNKESFFQRSLPMSAALGFGTFAAVQAGYFKANARFGAFPKVTLAVAVGYFLGKLSYQQACAEKLMALPGSYIGQLLRDRRDGKIGGNASMGGQTAGSSMLGAVPADIYSDAGPGSSLDLDSNRPPFSEDTSRPDHIASGGPDASAPPPPPSHSYDELRRRNRGEFADAKQDPYRVEPPLRPRPPPPPRPSVTNQYGDALD